MPRPKGSENKKREFLNSRLRDMYGEDFDPIMRAAECATLLHAEALDATDKDAASALKAATDAWLKIGEYIHPKLKAVEHSVGDELQDDLTQLLGEIASDATGPDKEQS